MIIHGFHPVREALRHRPHEIDRVLVGGRRVGGRREEIEELCRRHGVACQRVGAAALEALARGVHNGFVAEVREMAAVVGGDPEFVLLVEDVQDPRNLGALLRVCEGAGVGRVLIRDRGSAPLSATVGKTSAGASEWLAIERITNTGIALGRLQKEGFWIYGTAAEGLPPWQIDLRGKVVICIGGEEKGLRQRTRQLCDGLVGLPMAGRVQSLNLSTAAAAVLYEAVRQRSSSNVKERPQAPALAGDGETG